MAEMRYMISDVSRILDIPTNVLRKLEYHLSLNIKRTEVGYRYYLQEDVDLLRSVKVLREKGFHVKIIKSILPYIDKVVAMESERLDDMRMQMEAALGLSGIEAQERARDQYGKGIDTNREEDYKNSELSTKEATETDMPDTALDDCSQEHKRRPAIKVIKADHAVKSTSKDTVQTKDTKDHTSTRKSSSKERETVKVKKIEKGNTVGDCESEEVIASQEKVCIETDIETKTQLEPYADKKLPPNALQDNDKIIQFRDIMCSIVMDALRQNNRCLTTDINDTVTQSIVKEMDYMMKTREEHQEERFRQIDRAIRETQLQRQQAAASKEEKKKRKSKFFRKHKVRI